MKGETRNAVEEEDIAMQCRHSFDTETLLLCRKVSSSWKYSIDSFSGLWNRMPLEKAIKKKRIYICKLNIAHSDDKNPDNRKGKTTLHWAASWGHTELCLLIIDNTEEKYPTDDERGLPCLRLQLEGTQKFVSWSFLNVVNKNPNNHLGNTPLYFLL